MVILKFWNFRNLEIFGIFFCFGNFQNLSIGDFENLSYGEFGNFWNFDIFCLLMFQMTPLIICQKSFEISMNSYSPMVLEYVIDFSQNENNWQIIEEMSQAACSHKTRR